MGRSLPGREGMGAPKWRRHTPEQRREKAAEIVSMTAQWRIAVKNGEDPRRGECRRIMIAVNKLVGEIATTGGGAFALVKDITDIDDLLLILQPVAFRGETALDEEMSTRRWWGDGGAE